MSEQANPSTDKREEVLTFWLGETNADGAASGDKKKTWYMKDDAFDSDITTRFEGTYNAIMAGEREDWLTTAKGRLAYVLVLDQFSRNMFRGTAKMYSGDDRALAAAKAGIANGHDKALGISGRVFMYMPLMHSEALEDQNECIAQFAAFAEEAPEAYKEGLLNSHGYAVKHMVIVEKYGRFPHRNEILSRESTPEEVEFLKQPGSGF